VWEAEQFKIKFDEPIQLYWGITKKKVSGFDLNLQIWEAVKTFILAYVDPGVGTLAWQTVVSAFIGLFFYLRKTRNWVVKVLLKLFQSK
jgi:hypothetical protein